MKAQHRKELQTNTLAAGMGRMVKNIKTGPSRRAVLITLAVLALIGAGVGYLFWSNARARASAELWVKLDDMRQPDIDELAKDHRDKKQGLAARFQLAYLELWEVGLKRLGADPITAMNFLKSVSEKYEALAEDAAEYPTLASEARFNIAVAREALAVDDMKNLDEAFALYKKVAADFPNTAHGKEAAERVKQFNDPAARAKLEQFYQQLNQRVQFDVMFNRRLAPQTDAPKKR
jgi:hypothetical protein